MRSSRNQAFLVLLTSVVVSPAAGQTPALPQERPALQTQGLDPYDRVHLQISPRPTESPEANDDELFRRADDDTSVPSNVCGFLTRNRSTFPCLADSTCTNSGNFRACCRGAACTTSPFSSVCLDSTEPACSSSTAGTMCCNTDSTHTLCVTYLWATTATPNQVFSLFVCDTEQFAGQQILDSEPRKETATSDTATEGTSTRPTSDASPSGPVPTPPSNGGKDEANDGDGDGKANDNDNDNDGDGDGDSKAKEAINVGAIVGGVIGGVAMVGIIILAAVWMILRNRKAKRNAADNANNNYNGAGDNFGSASSQGRPPDSMYAQSAFSPSGYQPVSTQGQSGYQSYGDASKFSPQSQPGQFGGHEPKMESSAVVNEAPTLNPLGMGTNRAELES